MSEFQTLLADEEATIEFGKRLAVATFIEAQDSREAIAAGQGVPTCGGIVHLIGDLGAGKTTLTRGIMRGFGYQGAVKSPTYTLVEPYEFERCQIYHFDLYRLADPEEVLYLGIDDYFSGSNLCIIEWADKGANLIPPADLRIELETEGTGRRLNCQTVSAKGEAIAKRLLKKGRNL
ncbi:MAG: tRNA (adenosine(37)-N6)-threonylcarbamoyltransferase complex ATPase subunit type 1 TsaE [Proteobacteria bacterium]|nr:tRNA (adenosine(37)-N6)-threonylcarbamoyltransferase complex ATPase subunit type 1 TsaE [Pseudomonadota bacterium]